MLEPGFEAIGSSRGAFGDQDNDVHDAWRVTVCVGKEPEVL